MEKFRKNKYFIITIFFSILLSLFINAKTTEAVDNWYYKTAFGVTMGPFSETNCRAEVAKVGGGVQKDCYIETNTSYVPIGAQKEEGYINSTKYTLLSKLPGIKGNCIDTNPETVAQNGCASGGVGDFVNLLVQLAIGICGALAVVMIFINGIKYMGDESVFGHTESIEGIKSAVFGLMIALGSYAILNTVDPALLGKNGISIDQVSADIEEETEPFTEYQQPGIGTKVTGCSKGTANVTVSWGNPKVISVCNDVSVSLANMLTAAHNAGYNISGYGLRTNASQIALRKKHGCPDIYNSPSSACNPPTARPGRSMHERGLAIDLNCNGGRIEGTGCYTWLKNNASKYGFYNLASEPWHWSTTGK